MAAGATTVESLLKLVASPAKMREIAPGLTIRGAVAPPASPTPPAERPAHAALLAEGLGRLGAVASIDLCARLVSAIEALHALELPAAFVYAFDEAWALGERVRERIASLVGQDYALVEDVWAWLIRPGSAGWPAHRGISRVVLGREAPEVINVWIALTDVTPERACMHAVPLVDDPGYPASLERIEAPPAEARPLPAPAGDALFWNANVLHWGGRCAVQAAGPRVSCSFTLCRADATARFPELKLLRPLTGFDLAARMDALARMVLVYGDADRGDVRAVVREWAAVTHALATRFSSSTPT